MHIIFNNTVYTKIIDSTIIYCVSTVSTQYIQRPYVVVQLGYIWQHVSAVNRPSSGRRRIILLKYSQWTNNLIVP
jgi:hypothetical protein